MGKLLTLLKMATKPRTIIAAAQLLSEIGSAYEDASLSDAERSRVMKALWHLVRVYRGTE